MMISWGFSATRFVNINIVAVLLLSLYFEDNESFSFLLSLCLNWPTPPCNAPPTSQRNATSTHMNLADSNLPTPIRRMIFWLIIVGAVDLVMVWTLAISRILIDANKIPENGKEAVCEYKPLGADT